MIQRILIVLLAATLGSLLTSPAQADLLIRGGTVDQRASVQTLYDHLPDCCKSSCVTIQLLGNKEMDAYLRDAEGTQSYRYNNSAIDGLYQDRITTVSLRVASDKADITSQFAHEYGHYIWFRTLSSDQRDQYRNVYKSEPASHLITRYAAESVEEGFAEAYSTYVRDPALLERCDPKSCDCLECYLKSENANIAR